MFGGILHRKKPSGEGEPTRSKTITARRRRRKMTKKRMIMKKRKRKRTSREEKDSRKELPEEKVIFQKKKIGALGHLHENVANLQASFLARRPTMGDRVSNSRSPAGIRPGWRRRG